MTVYSNSGALDIFKGINEDMNEFGLIIMEEWNLKHLATVSQLMWTVLPVFSV